MAQKYYPDPSMTSRVDMRNDLYTKDGSPLDTATGYAAWARSAERFGGRMSGGIPSSSGYSPAPRVSDEPVPQATPAKRRPAASEGLSLVEVAKAGKTRAENFADAAKVELAMDEQRGIEADFGFRNLTRMLRSAASSQNWGDYFAIRNLITNDKAYQYAPETQRMIQENDVALGGAGEFYLSDYETKVSLPRVFQMAQSASKDDRLEAYRILSGMTSAPDAFAARVAPPAGTDPGGLFRSELLTLIERKPLITDADKLEKRNVARRKFQDRIEEVFKDNPEALAKFRASPEYQLELENIDRVSLLGKAPLLSTEYETILGPSLSDAGFNALRFHIRDDIDDSAGWLSQTRWIGEGWDMITGRQAAADATISLDPALSGIINRPIFDQQTKATLGMQGDQLARGFGQGNMGAIYDDDTFLEAAGRAIASAPEDLAKHVVSQTAGVAATSFFLQPDKFNTYVKGVLKTAMDDERAAMAKVLGESLDPAVSNKIYGNTARVVDNMLEATEYISAAAAAGASPPAPPAFDFNYLSRGLDGLSDRITATRASASDEDLAAMLAKVADIEELIQNAPKNDVDGTLAKLARMAEDLRGTVSDPYRAASLESIEKVRKAVSEELGESAKIIRKYGLTQPDVVENSLDNIIVKFGQLKPGDESLRSLLSDSREILADYKGSLDKLYKAELSKLTQADADLVRNALKGTDIAKLKKAATPASVGEDVFNALKEIKIQLVREPKLVELMKELDSLSDDAWRAADDFLKSVQKARDNHTKIMKAISKESFSFTDDVFRAVNESVQGLGDAAKAFGESSAKYAEELVKTPLPGAAHANQAAAFKQYNVQKAYLDVQRTAAANARDKLYGVTLDMFERVVRPDWDNKMFKALKETNEEKVEALITEAIQNEWKKKGLPALDPTALAAKVAERRGQLKIAKNHSVELLSSVFDDLMGNAQRYIDDVDGMVEYLFSSSDRGAAQLRSAASFGNMDSFKRRKVAEALIKEAKIAARRFPGIGTVGKGVSLYGADAGAGAGTVGKTLKLLDTAVSNADELLKETTGEIDKITKALTSNADDLTKAANAGYRQLAKEVFGLGEDVAASVEKPTGLNRLKGMFSRKGVEAGSKTRGSMLKWLAGRGIWFPGAQQYATSVGKEALKAVGKGAAKSTAFNVAARLGGQAVGMAIDAAFFYNDAGRDMAQVNGEFDALEQLRGMVARYGSSAVEQPGFQEAFARGALAVDNLNKISEAHKTRFKVALTDFVNPTILINMQKRMALREAEEYDRQRRALTARGAMYSPAERMELASQPAPSMTGWDAYAASN